MSNSLAVAKRILSDNSEVLYGIFGIIEVSGYFPPLAFLNEFLMKGSDPCDQDQRMDDWKPFEISEGEYADIKRWWIAMNPGAVEDALGEDCWEDWVQEILDR